MRVAVLGVFALMSVLSSCLPEPSAPVKRENLIGEYVYFSADDGARHDADRLTLRADGKYVLIRMPGGRRGPTETGTWRLITGSVATVELDRAGYPVRVRGGRVRLMINDDLGHWYEKTGRADEAGPNTLDQPPSGHQEPHRGGEKGALSPFDLLASG